MVGQAGSIAGSRFFPKEEGPFYVKGMAISAGLLFFAALLAQFLRVLLAFENKQRDRLHGTSHITDMSHDVANEGDAHPSYRFML